MKHEYATVITVANQKGGVAKTTSVISMAAGLQRRGYKVLVVDFDPQASLSKCLFADRDQDENAGIYAALKKNGRRPIDQVIEHMDMFDLIPANLQLANYEVELLNSSLGQDTQLKRAIAPLRKMYDYILIDTGPALGLLTINALCACDEVICPMVPEVASMQALVRFLSTIQRIRLYSNPDLTIAGILFTKNFRRLVNSRAVIDATKQHVAEIATQESEIDGEIVPPIKTKVFEADIRQLVAATESQSAGTDIYSYAPDSEIVQDYEAFIDEYLEGVKKNG